MEGDPIRVIRHTAAPRIPDSGSYEVRFSDGRESVYFYWDDNAGRRSVRHVDDANTAMEKAKAFAREELDKLK